MSLKAFNKIKIILLFLIMFAMGISIYFELFFVGAFAVGLGMVIISFFKTQVKEIIEDERIENIHEKAARSSFKILMPILGLTSLALFYSGDGPFYFLRSLGIILGYVTLVGLGVYLISYYYFNRKYGA